MGLWVLRVFVVVVVVAVLFLGVVSAEINNQVQDENVITWDDMRVDLTKEKMGLREERNRSRVIVVDWNGSGDSVTVQGAVDMVPLHNSERVKIYILPGIYREKVLVPDSKPYISFIGDENRTSETIITWHNKASDKDKDGSEIGTFGSASVEVESDYFCATGITISNTVVAVPGGYGMQAVALRLSGDKAMLYKVQILGAQDTLLDDNGSHYFYQCHIQGTVDFIFGSSKSLYQDCVLHSTATRFGAIAAHHRNSEDEDTGFSFVNCTINGTGNILLGRAWGDYSRAIYSYCDIDNIIIPSGWSDWDQPSRQKTAVFGEYKCRGKGANRRYRVPWSKNFSYEEARRFLDMKFIEGEQWLRL
ncbi:hypothetical protein HYC85_011558 [Camellia sinensis]|uniref:Pectinesterase n=1 Tax=Camellia sinensis TaxID=4442 RepID=A0A7J7HAC2_CAMSI|nr:hypothetical protein HYC85_011558 [Camellia sinensis]